MTHYNYHNHNHNHHHNYHHHHNFTNIHDSTPTHPNTQLILSKFTLYETKTRFYIVGSNQSDNYYRILKIDRTSIDELNITEDEVVYTKSECIELLSMIDQGNLQAGGLQKVCSGFGIIGFIKFTQGYYINLITKRTAIALIGGHYIYHIEDTALLPISRNSLGERRPDEARYVSIFQNMDMTKNFYFSYTYDITHPLQYNITRLNPHNLEAQHFGTGGIGAGYREEFVWNSYLLKNGFGKNCLKGSSYWVLPIIYGFLDQARISVLGIPIAVTLIARRSCKYAGARFLKRGVNDEGYVANEVETEQIVNCMEPTALYLPQKTEDGVVYYVPNPRYTSFIQHRGSIPLSWVQDPSNMAPKPQIELTLPDPFHSRAASHFDSMFQRYGAPIIVLNLIKAKEKTPRESKLLPPFKDMTSYLNKCLKDSTKIIYVPWDMSRASKSRDHDVINWLESFSEDALNITNFFHPGPEPYAWYDKRQSNPDDENHNQPRYPYLLQKGIVRTNCIDCIDRTNAAQFMIGKSALAHQLHGLGIISEPYLPFDCNAIDILTEMYHDHGDTLALQYGGSLLVNNMATYRKINQNWSSHSRDVIEAIRRFYSNSFVDAEKQDAINLFLGVYQPLQHSKKLWELSTDYWLHNTRFKLGVKRRKDYINWFNPSYLNNWNPSEFPWKDPSFHSLTKSVKPLPFHLLKDTTHPEDSDSDLMEEELDPQKVYWNEYYRPKLFTSFGKLLAFNMNSTLDIDIQMGFDRSPFHVYKPQIPSINEQALNVARFGRWIQFNNNRGSRNRKKNTLLEQDSNSDQNNQQQQQRSQTPNNSEINTSLTNPLETLIETLTNPHIATPELEEYERYVDQYNTITYGTVLLNYDNTNQLTYLDPEYQLLNNYVNKATSCEISTSNGDLEKFNSYVQLPQVSSSANFVVGSLEGRGSGSIGGGVGGGKVEAYAAWLSEGRYVRPVKKGGNKADDSIVNVGSDSISSGTGQGSKRVKPT